MCDLSVVIVNANTRELTCQCLNSLYSNPPKCRYEIIVVDNASTDGSCEAIESTYPEVRLIRNDQNLGFAVANNRAFEIAKGEHILLLNNDTIVPPGSVDKLLAVLDQDASVGVVAPKLVYPDGSLQMSYGPMPSIFVSFCSFFEVKKWFPPGVALRFADWGGKRSVGKNTRSYVEWLSGKHPETAKLEKHNLVTGACMLIRGSCFRQVGPFDPAFFMYVDDADYSKRVYDAGWEILYLAEAAVIHIKGGTAGERYRWTSPVAYFSVFHFLKKHRGKMAALIVKGFALSSVVLRSICNTLTRPHRAAASWKLLWAIAAGPRQTSSSSFRSGRRLDEESGQAAD